MSRLSKALARWLPSSTEPTEHPLADRVGASSIERPGAGPTLVAFSNLEIHALTKYAIGYPLEEATPAEAAAFDAGLRKIKEAGERKSQKRARAKKYGGGR